MFLIKSSFSPCRLVFDFIRALFLVLAMFVGIAYAATSVPTVSISSPANNATMSPGTITVQGAASAFFGVSKVEAYMVPTSSTTTPYRTAAKSTTKSSVNWNISFSITTPGAYRIEARVTDVLGKTARASITVNIAGMDNTPPNFSVISPAPSAVFNLGMIAVKGTASDTSGIARVEIAVDNRAPDDTAVNTNWIMATPRAPGDWSTWSVNLNLSKATSYRVIARALDNAGNDTWWDVTIRGVPPLLRDHIEFGAVNYGAYGLDLASLENMLGQPIEIASEFVDWTYIFGNANDAALAANGTRKLMFSWEPWGSSRFATIARGDYDDYLNQVAISLSSFPYTVYVRPWPEMNGNWSSWQPTPNGEKPNGGTPAEFIAAWRHLVTFFRSRNINNIKFIFNPEASSWQNTPITDIWPGAEYVDILGIDGYNLGKDSNGNVWREFDTVFSEMYGTLTALHSTAPVWICEFGSKEPLVNDGAPIDTAHSKAQWIHNAMQSTQFPRIKTMSYFNLKKERDWRLESSTDSLNAMREELSLHHAPNY